MDIGSPIRSKNGRLQVAVVAQIPEALLRLLFGEQDSEAPGSTDAAHAERYRLLLQNALSAVSMDGRHLALAYAERFMLLEQPDDASASYRLVSVGSEAASPGESVTALYCLDIYTPSLRAGPQQRSGKVDGQSLCVAVGYSSGYVRMFSVYGHLLTAHQLHTQPLLRIRHRLPAQVAAGVLGTATTQAGLQSAPGDTEEVCLTFADGAVVSIDGQSLYLALRVCLSEVATGDSGEPAFQYKTWSFDMRTPQVYDVASYGPATSRDPLVLAAKASMTSSPQLSDATARFLVAPVAGEAAFGVFATNEEVAVSYSAVDLAGRVAAKVTGAMLSMARSYFWRSSPLSGGGADSSGSRTDAARQGSPSRTEQGTVVPCVFAVRDSPRKVVDIALAPAQYGLAALTDSLGRVTIFDLASSEAVHMLKGLRGSRCAWLEAEKGVPAQQRMRVVVCAAKRGVVEVFGLDAMDSPLASLNIGPGWALVQCPTQPLGGSLLVGSGGSERRATHPRPASCILLSDRGQVARIAVDAS
ncbi:hypothetical protein IWQ56_002446 [Coemansia nantahalensis]|nr:hypothetical protein IWQ56_002446 [Coemansia nantahalensis]